MNINLLATTEEQARVRSETQRPSQTAPNAAPNPHVFHQANTSNQQPQNPLGNMMGLLGNFMQGFNQPAGQSHFSTATFDLSSLFVPPPVPTPAGQPAPGATVHIHQTPHGHVHIVRGGTSPAPAAGGQPSGQSPAAPTQVRKQVFLDDFLMLRQPLEKGQGG